MFGLAVGTFAWVVVLLGVVACRLAQHDRRLPLIVRSLSELPTTLENLAYDIRVRLIPHEPLTQKVVVIPKPGSRGSNAVPLRSLMAKAITNLRASGVRAIGVDLLLLEEKASQDSVDAALAEVLSGEDVVLACAIQKGESVLLQKPATSRSLSFTGNQTVQTYLWPLKRFREATPFLGLINLELGVDLAKTLRGVELWRWDNLHQAWLPSLAFQLFLVELTRDGMDRLNVRRGDPRISELEKCVASVADKPLSTSTPTVLEEALLNAADRLRGATCPSVFGNRGADELLARTELSVLLLRAGASGGAARRFSERISGSRLTNFLPIAPRHLGTSPGLLPAPSYTARRDVLEDRERREPSRLTIDFHGRRGSSDSPFFILPLTLVSDPEALDATVTAREIATGQSNLVVSMRPPGEARLSGRVSWSDGVPVAGARVLLESDDGRPVQVRSDVDGRFSLDGVTPGVTRIRLDVEVGAVKIRTVQSGPVVDRKSVVWNVTVPKPTARLVVDRMTGLSTGSELLLSSRALTGLENPTRRGGCVVSVPISTDSFPLQLPLVPPGNYNLRHVRAGARGGSVRTLSLKEGTARCELNLSPSGPPSRNGSIEGMVEPAQEARIEAVDLEAGQTISGQSDRAGRFRIDHLHDGPHLVLATAGSLAGMARSWGDPLRGNIALIGTRLLEDQDYFRSPADHGTGSITFGVEMHAFVLDNLLDGTWVSDLSLAASHGAWPLSSVLVTLLLSVVAGLVFSCLRLSRAIPVWFTLVGVFLGCSVWLLATWKVWIDVVVPVAAALLVLTAFVARHVVLERQEVIRRKTIFSRFVAPDMVDRILDLGELTLGGERSNITVLFSDIRGFTTLSENRDPKAILDLLNDYFSCMAPILKKHHGTLDKYIGDAIMGFFGAPIPFTDHPRQAVSAAVEMLAMNERLRIERPGWFDIGFGINTGVAVTGLLGARDGAVNYSAIGDTVNLASRLEGLNKEYGTHILISEATYLAVRDSFEVRPIPGEVKVKGKKEGVRVFEVLGWKTPNRESRGVLANHGVGGPDAAG